MNLKNIFYLSGSQSEKSESNYYQKMLNSILLKNQEFNFYFYNCSNLPLMQCEGCGNCFKYGSCQLDEKDNFSYVKRNILNSDLIIVFCPVYSDNVTSFVKNFIDRIVCWAHFMYLAKKKCVIITLCSNSAEFTARYLYNVATRLGMKVIEIMVLYSGHFEDNNRKIKNVANKIILEKDTADSYYSSDLESYFETLKKHYQSKKCFPNEMKIWNEHKGFNSSNFKEYMENLRR